MVLVQRLLAAALFVALLVGGWYFAAENAVAVTVNHPGGTLGEYKLWVALSGAFGLGVVLTMLFAIVRGIRLRLVARRYKKMLAGLQAEIHQLRSLPLADRADTEMELADHEPELERGS